MSRSWWSKFLLLLAVTTMGIVYVYPTVGNIELGNDQVSVQAQDQSWSRLAGRLVHGSRHRLQ